MAGAKELFTCVDPVRWLKVLSAYPSCIDALSKRNTKVHRYIKEDDMFVRSELPNLVREQGGVTKEQLSRVMRWKLARGQWRPLQGKVDQNDPVKVVEASQEAVKAMSEQRVGDAVTALTVLKAVGPATASAVLAAIDPSLAPFMSDEAVVAALNPTKITYSMKEYLELQKLLVAKAARLTALGDGGVTWTANQVGDALWAAERLSKGEGVLEEDDAVTDPEPPSKRVKKG
eukprot:Sspe_Gene.108208::Locus_87374_Transcript_1_1_Confidence_1.000_Length_829::g.108208::m.108208